MDVPSKDVSTLVVTVGDAWAGATKAGTAIIVARASVARVTSLKGASPTGARRAACLQDCRNRGSRSPVEGSAPTTLKNGPRRSRRVRLVLALSLALVLPGVAGCLASTSTPSANVSALLSQPLFNATKKEQALLPM